MRIRRRVSGKYSLFICLLIIHFLVTSVPSFDIIDPAAIARSEPGGNNTFANNTSPRILTKEIPTIHELPFRYQIEAVDNETPVEFLTYDIVNHGYGAYMERNELVIDDERGTFYVTVEVRDFEGLSDEREYRINEDIQEYTQRAQIVKSPERVGMDGLTRVITIGPGPENDVQFRKPSGEWDYDLKATDGKHFTASEIHDENSSVQITRKYERSLEGRYFIGSEVLRIELSSFYPDYTLFVNISLDLLPVINPFRIVPLVDLANITTEDHVVLAIERDGKLLTYEIDTINWDLDSADRHFSGNYIFRYRIDESGDHNITAEFTLDSDRRAQYFCQYNIHVTEYEPSDDRGGGNAISPITVVGLTLIVLIFIILAIIFDTVVLRRRETR